MTLLYQQIQSLIRQHGLRPFIDAVSGVLTINSHNGGMIPNYTEDFPPRVADEEVDDWLKRVADKEDLVNPDNLRIAAVNLAKDLY